eukprot:CAMPEP_0181190464 /NCGR_PEP_ID=MMETSP1096-20121128/12206_1 /TAXON_ID=156174 ORGANISM="Chrysochromulina ericina, Strain CCMP281" /NCGR_SAMPLE_ID=MMETSP1096 /ASSEMBLY_ACC=CAM_ASM_000453 /LENGTH=39 /DNA_ID= /DNA_START= /DNA_END= /DNA_ORIENTATION=
MHVAVDGASSEAPSSQHQQSLSSQALVPLYGAEPLIAFA